MNLHRNIQLSIVFAVAMALLSITAQAGMVVLTPSPSTSLIPITSKTTNDLTESEINNPLGLTAQRIMEAKEGSLLRAVTQLQSYSDLSYKPELISRWAQLKYGLPETFKFQFEADAKGAKLEPSKGVLIFDTFTKIDLASLKADNSLIGLKLNYNPGRREGGNWIRPESNVELDYKDSKKVTIKGESTITVANGKIISDGLAIKPESKDLTIYTSLNSYHLNGKGEIETKDKKIQFENDVRIDTDPDGLFHSADLAYDKTTGKNSKVTIDGKTVKSNMDGLSIVQSKSVHDMRASGNNMLLTDNGFEFRSYEEKPAGEVTIEQPGHPIEKIVDGKRLQLDTKTLTAPAAALGDTNPQTLIATTSPADKPKVDMDKLKAAKAAAGDSIARLFQEAFGVETKSERFAMSKAFMESEGKTYIRGSAEDNMYILGKIRDAIDRGDEATISRLMGSGSRSDSVTTTSATAQLQDRTEQLARRLVAMVQGGQDVTTSSVGRLMRKITGENRLSLVSEYMRRDLSGAELDSLSSFVHKFAGNDVKYILGWVGARERIETSAGMTGPFHTGVDVPLRQLPNPWITPPVGATYNKEESKTGNLVYDLPNGDQIVYKHARLAKAKGETVIRYAATGRTTGPHVHIEWRDPNGKLLDPASGNLVNQKKPVYAWKRPMRATKTPALAD